MFLILVVAVEMGGVPYPGGSSGDGGVPVPGAGL